MMGRHQAPLTERVLMLGLTAADPTSSTSTISVTSTTTYRNYQAERSRPRAIGSGEWHEKGVTGRRPLCLGHPHCAARSVRMQARAHLQTPPTGASDSPTPQHERTALTHVTLTISAEVSDATVWRRALRRDTTR